MPRLLSCGFAAALIFVLSVAQTLAQPPATSADPAKADIQLPEPARSDLPSLILIGDSTVRNGRDDVGKSADAQWGWGSPLAGYLDLNKINVVNRAVGGLSSRTYRTSGQWDRTKALIKKGDWVIMQFGPNDAGPINDNSRARGVLPGTGPEKQDINNLLTGKPETVLTYGAYLRSYVADIRAAGATPVICSPVAQKRWKGDGTTLDRALGSFASWAAEVARQEHTAFIDLNEAGALRYEALGRAKVDELFPRTEPPETVHTNLAGATLNAQLVVIGLMKQKVLPDSFFTQRFTNR